MQKAHIENLIVFLRTKGMTVKVLRMGRLSIGTGVSLYLSLVLSALRDEPPPIIIEVIKMLIEVGEEDFIQPILILPPNLLTKLVNQLITNEFDRAKAQYDKNGSDTFFRGNSIIVFNKLFAIESDLYSNEVDAFVGRVLYPHLDMLAQQIKKDYPFQSEAQENAFAEVVKTKFQELIQAILIAQDELPVYIKSHASVIKTAYEKDITPSHQIAKKVARLLILNWLNPIILFTLHPRISIQQKFTSAQTVFFQKLLRMAVTAPLQRLGNNKFPTEKDMTDRRDPYSYVYPVAEKFQSVFPKFLLDLAVPLPNDETELFKQGATKTKFEQDLSAHEGELLKVMNSFGENNTITRRSSIATKTGDPALLKLINATQKNRRASLGAKSHSHVWRRRGFMTSFGRRRCGLDVPQEELSRSRSSSISSRG